MDHESDPMGHLYRSLGHKKNLEHKRLQEENEHLKQQNETLIDILEKLNGMSAYQVLDHLFIVNSKLKEIKQK